MTLVKIILLSIIVFTLMITGCKNAEDENSSLIFEELNENLERSNEYLIQDIALSLQFLKNLTKKPETAEKATNILSKAKLVEFHSLKVINLIDSLAEEIKKEIRAKILINKQKEKDFISTGGKRFYESIIQYRKDISGIDEQVKVEPEEKLIINGKKFQALFPDEEVFSKFYFKDKSGSQALVTLSKFKNDVLSCERNAIYYFRNSICELNIIYDDFPTTITSQNSKHFKKGDELVIKTGIGSFKVENIKEIIINYTKVKETYGVGEYKIKIEKKPGEYRIPIQIKFIDSDGKEIVFSDEVKYIVD